MADIRWYTKGTRLRAPGLSAAGLYLSSTDESVASNDQAEFDIGRDTLTMLNAGIKEALPPDLVVQRAATPQVSGGAAQQAIFHAACFNGELELARRMAGGLGACCRIRIRVAVSSSNKKSSVLPF